MFSKNSEKLESFIGPSTQFTGDVKSNGTLRIDGRIDGNLEADCLIVGPSAQIRGNVSARSIIVGGLVEGNLNGKEKVEIKNKGQVFGDIETAKLTVIEGGLINGKTTMTGNNKEIKALEFSKDNAA